MFHFGGEMFVKYESGDVHYQDEFGRTEKPREFLIKKVPDKPLRPGDMCGCGRGRQFKDCCQSKPEALRPSWNEVSIRERNLMLQNGIVNVLELESGKDWIQIRRELTDDKISKIYNLYEALWPLETDLLALLPKPDGVARAVYTGSIHPSSITDFAFAAPLYFGELIVAHPFVHSGIMKKEMSPTGNPKSYRQEFLKTILFFLNVMPLVDLGLVNLIPDPCDFDFHLREQMMSMARARSAATQYDSKKDPRLQKQMEEDNRRGIMLMPPDAMRRQLRELNPNLDEEQFVGRFAKAHAAAQGDFKKSGVPIKEGRISCVFPPGGIQDNTVNRLLLMSSSESHLSSVPMAFFIEPADEVLVGDKGPLAQG